MNQTNINFYSFNFAELFFDPKQVRGEGGNLNPRLTFPIKLRLKELDDESVKRIPRFIVNSVKANLFIYNDSEKISESFLITDILVQHTRESSNSLRLEFPFETNKVARVELLRAADLKLNIKINFQLSILDPINVKLEGNYEETKYFVTRYEQISSDFNLEIPQSYWLNSVLPQIGYGDYFVIELPKGNNKITEAWSYVTHAENAVNTWDSKSVFANCREVGKLLDGKLRKELGKDSFAYSQRWKKRYSNYNEFSSLDLHLEEIKSNSNKYKTEEVKTFKSDAENMILSAKILIKYAQELMNE